MRSGIFTFDARVFSVPDDETALRNILWRSNFDCRRNSIAALGAFHLKGRGGRQANMSTRDVLDRLRAQGIEWSASPARFKFGALVKKERYMKDGVDPRSQLPVAVMRTRIAVRSFRVSTSPVRGVPLLFRKYWDEYDLLCKALDEQKAGGAPVPADVDDEDLDDDDDDEVEQDGAEKEGAKDASSTTEDAAAGAAPDAS